jgi:hypothetical protein
MYYPPRNHSSHAPQHDLHVCRMEKTATSRELFILVKQCPLSHLRVNAEPLNSGTSITKRVFAKTMSHTNLFLFSFILTPIMIQRHILVYQKNDKRFLLRLEISPRVPEQAGELVSHTKHAALHPTVFCPLRSTTMQNNILVCQTTAKGSFHWGSNPGPRPHEDRMTIML